MKFKVIREETVFNDFIAVKKGTIVRGGEEEFTRVRVQRDDASVMLIHNIEANTVVLVEQFRYAVHQHTPEPVLEIAAGKIDPGETPEEAAIRETLEECGYRIKQVNLKKLGTYYVSPGYTSERFVLFFATVKNEDKIEKGGGLKSENEYINVVELSPTQFYEALENGKICDVKTALAAQLVKNELM